MNNLRRLNFAALLALETAERYRSFTAATRELNVTRSAVSHRIIQIEALLKKSLFERIQSQMIPTSTCTRVAARSQADGTAWHPCTAQAQVHCDDDIIRAGYTQRSTTSAP